MCQAIRSRVPGKLAKETQPVSHGVPLDAAIAKDGSTSLLKMGTGCGRNQILTNCQQRCLSGDQKLTKSTASSRTPKHWQPTTGKICLSACLMETARVRVRNLDNC